MTLTEMQELIDISKPEIKALVKTGEIDLAQMRKQYFNYWGCDSPMTDDQIIEYCCTQQVDIDGADLAISMRAFEREYLKIW